MPFGMQSAIDIGSAVAGYHAWQHAPKGLQYYKGKPPSAPGHIPVPFAQLMDNFQPTLPSPPPFEPAPPTAFNRELWHHTSLLEKQGVLSIKPATLADFEICDATIFLQQKGSNKTLHIWNMKWANNTDPLTPPKFCLPTPQFFTDIIRYTKHHISTPRNPTHLLYLAHDTQDVYNSCVTPKLTTAILLDRNKAHML